jgi:hypothetical protein
MERFAFFSLKRCSIWSAMVVLLTVGISAGIALAEQPSKPVPPIAKLHPWAAFKPNSWKMVRELNETYDEKGQLVKTGVTETKTALCRVDAEGVTLEIETAAWVGGRLVTFRPQTAKQGFYSTLAGKESDFKATDLPDQKLTIEDKKIGCHVRQVEWVDKKNQRRHLIKTYFSETVEPFVLKRETTVKNLSDGKTAMTKVMMVDAFNMPWAFENDQIYSVTHSKTISRTEKSIKTTLAYHSTRVPGGIVSQHIKEVDFKGNLLRRSIVELIGFGTEMQRQTANRTGLFGRGLKKNPRPASRPNTQ